MQSLQEEVQENFQKRKVSKKLLKKIVEAGIHAPSSKNSQPWFFIVDSTKKKNRVADILEKKADETFTPMDPRTGKPAVKSTAKATAQIIRQAPAVIFVFSQSHFTGGKKEFLKIPKLQYLLSYSSEIQSISAAAQNMVLAAHALGLGSLWTCDVHYIEEDVKKIYNQKNELILAICIGHPKKKPSYEIKRLKHYKFLG